MRRCKKLRLPRVLLLQVAVTPSGSSMHRLRIGLLVAAALCVLAFSLRATHGNAQTPQPVATAAPDPGLSLQLSQRFVPANGGAVQQIEVTISSSYAVQVRLFENRAALLFDGFTSTAPITVTLTHVRDCGRRLSYDLYAIVDGGIAASRSASLVLCPESVPAASPTPIPAPAATAAAGAAAPAPPPPAPAIAAPSRATRKPGEPPVPAPPLAPPSEALASGFVVAAPDDTAAASAALSGTPYLRVLAIWLRGTDSDGQGGGDYQYVQIANLGGAAQDLSGWALQGDSGTIGGLMFYFPGGFALDAGASCRIYVGQPAENTCTAGSFALYHFWGEHGTATLWDDQGSRADSLSY